jgi:hypothetical protein
MREQSTERLIESRACWEDVEAFARQRIQSWFQRLLEEEIEELLGDRATCGVTGSMHRPATATAWGSHAG